MIAEVLFGVCVLCVVCVVFLFFLHLNSNMICSVTILLSVCSIMCVGGFVFVFVCLLLLLFFGFVVVVVVPVIVVVFWGAGEEYYLN